MLQSVSSPSIDMSSSEDATVLPSDALTLTLPPPPSMVGDAASTTATTSSPSPEKETTTTQMKKRDRLSELPEHLLLHIVSFLPTHLAVRLSLLSRPFRRLWAASPSLHLDRSSIRRTPRFVLLADRFLSLRDPSAPLRRLRLYSDYSARRLLDPLDPITWLLRSRPLGLRHLDLSLHHETLIFLLPIILDFETLESLSLSTFSTPYGDTDTVLPDTIRLSRLKRLSLYLRLEPLSLTRLVAAAPVLEDVNLKDVKAKQVDLNAPNLKLLHLNSYWLPEVRLWCPKLELLRFSSSGGLVKFKGFMPSLRRACVRLSGLTAEDAAAVGGLIKSVANVSELKIHVSECWSPYIDNKKKKAKKDRQSKLPRNSSGNYQTAFFTDLRVKKRRNEAVKLLSKRLKLKE